jgi:hypothetical protein
MCECVIALAKGDRSVRQTGFGCLVARVVVTALVGSPAVAVPAAMDAFVGVAVGACPPALPIRLRGTMCIVCVCPSRTSVQTRCVEIWFRIVKGGALLHGVPDDLDLACGL